jgi:hypothetical protein
MTDKNKIKTIDCTPTWEGMLPSILALIEEGNGTKESYKIAKEELLRMAKIADQYAALVKSSTEQQVFRVVFPVSLKAPIDTILNKMKEESKVV